MVIFQFFHFVLYFGFSIFNSLLFIFFCPYFNFLWCFIFFSANYMEAEIGELSFRLLYNKMVIRTAKLAFPSYDPIEKHRRIYSHTQECIYMSMSV